MPIKFSIMLWRIQTHVKCLLCNTQEEESRTHLFFNCWYLDSRRVLLGIAKVQNNSYWKLASLPTPTLQVLQVLISGWEISSKSLKNSLTNPYHGTCSGILLAVLLGTSGHAVHLKTPRSSHQGYHLGHEPFLQIWGF